MSRAARKIDKGRLIILPIFSLFMVINIVSLVEQVKAADSVSSIKIASLINNLLVAFFYALLVILYLIRTSAKSTTDSLTVKTVAVISTFLPFAIPFAGKQSNEPGIILFASLVTMFGMVISLYSLGMLGRSFSIIPQARTIVKSGPYKHVRHPVYLGEMIAVSGIVLARFSFSALAIFSLYMAAMVYRAMHEEKLLMSISPEYESSFVKKARFIPGIF